MSDVPPKSESSIAPGPPPVLPPAGLPPVQPPSGRFILQLFLVPGMIVLVITLLILAAFYVKGNSYQPEAFLREIDSENENVRWRGAADLAQVLKRKESAALKSNVGFALDLTERLQKAIDALQAKEKEIGPLVKDKNDAEKARQWKQLEGQRDYISFLAGALGEFYFPVGLGPIGKLLEGPESPDTKGHTYTRRHLLFVVGSMGKNLKAFRSDLLNETEKLQIIGDLAAEAKADTPRGRWARNALWYIDRSQVADVSQLIQADKLLAACAESPDQYQREQVALVLVSWDGDLVEPTLLKLARDTGAGEVYKVE